MQIIIISDFPEELLLQLKQRARWHHLSLNKEVINCLKRIFIKEPKELNKSQSTLTNKSNVATAAHSHSKTQLEEALLAGLDSGHAVRLTNKKEIRTFLSNKTKRKHK